MRCLRKSVTFPSYLALSRVPFYSGLQITRPVSTLIKERICLLYENIAHILRCPPLTPGHLITVTI
jgi:hypothetical protein